MPVKCEADYKAERYSDLISGIPKEELNRRIYRFCVQDIYSVAGEMGIFREFTEDEMYKIQRGIDSGLGECWTEIFQSAISEVEV